MILFPLPSLAVSFASDFTYLLSRLDYLRILLCPPGQTALLPLITSETGFAKPQASGHSFGLILSHYSLLKKKKKSEAEYSYCVIPGMTVHWF